MSVKIEEVPTDLPVDKVTVILGGGGASYDVAKAEVSIDDLIRELEDARDVGATHVVMRSGNYRGPAWASVRAEVTWFDEENEL